MPGSEEGSMYLEGSEPSEGETQESEEVGRGRWSRVLWVMVRNLDFI